MYNTLKIDDAGISSIPTLPKIRDSFVALPAITSKERLASYRCRYNAYVEDRGFEPPNQKHLEIDKFDSLPSTKAYLVWCVETGDVMGSCRILRPEDNQGPKPKKLPFFQLAKLHGFSLPAKIKSNTTCEFSRLAFPKKQKVVDNFLSTANLPAVLPQLLLARMLADEVQRKTSYGLMVIRPALRRMFEKKMGTIDVFGKVDHHGQRELCAFSFRETLENMKKNDELLYHSITFLIPNMKTKEDGVRQDLLKKAERKRPEIRPLHLKNLTC